MAVSSHQPGPFPLDDFLTHLSLQGFTIRVDHHLRLRLLLAQFRGESPQEYKTLLCPIFAKSENEQARFYDVFDSYFKQLKIHSVVPLGSEPFPPPPDDAKDSADPRSLLTPRLKIFVGAIAAGLIVILILNTRTEFIKYARSVFGPLTLP